MKKSSPYNGNPSFIANKLVQCLLLIIEMNSDGVYPRGSMGSYVSINSNNKVAL